MGFLDGGGSLFSVVVSASGLQGISGFSLNSRGTFSGSLLWMILVDRLVLAYDLLVELYFG